ncbi:uncharacterized protein LOC144444677 [Glandiceps talaboti]
MALLDKVSWSETSYTIRQVVEHFRLPKIFKVTRGVYGTEDTGSLANLQVVRIHQQYKQQRVIAADERGRHFSVPVDYDIPFEVVTGTSSKPESKYLSEILREHSLPKKVRFSNQMELEAWYIDNNVRVDNDFGSFTLMKVYDETYLHANAINNGVLHEAILLIPAYVKFEFCVAEGLQNGNVKEWADLKQGYDVIVKEKVDFSIKSGNRDISMYDFTRKVSENRFDYEHIEPNKTIRIRSRKSRLYEYNVDSEEKKTMNDSKMEFRQAAPRPLPPTPSTDYESPLGTDDGVTLLKKVPRAEMPKNDFSQKKKTPKKPEKGEQNRLGPKRGGKSDKKFKTLQEVPSDLTKLSVNQVCNLLQLLELGSITKVFDEKNIDGFELRKLSANQMVDVMGVSRADALRITTFVMENHKPKKKSSFSFF